MCPVAPITTTLDMRPRSSQPPATRLQATESVGQPTCRLILRLLPTPPRGPPSLRIPGRGGRPGRLPSDLATGTPAEIEEERRLFYVAMTRAKDALHLITPLRFYVHGQAARGDKHVYAVRTRFVPAHILDRFEQRAWAPRGSEAASAARPVPPRDLKARMQGMWA